MFSNSLLGLTSISQWALFVGIALILYGWIEKRESFVLGGQLVFLALGFLAFYILSTGTIPAPQPTGSPASKEIKVLSYFKIVAVFGGVNIASLFIKLLKPRIHKISLYVLLLFALMLFFMVFNIQKMAN